MVARSLARAGRAIPNLIDGKRRCPSCHDMIGTKNLARHLRACANHAPQAAPDAPQRTEPIETPTDTGVTQNGAQRVERPDRTGALKHGRLKMVRTTPHGTRSGDVAERMALEEPATGHELIECAFCPFIGTGNVLHRHNQTEHRDRYSVAAYNLGEGVPV